MMRASCSEMLFLATESLSSIMISLGVFSSSIHSLIMTRTPFTNWKQVPEDYNYYETMKKFVWENKEQTNKEHEDTEACHKNDINCTSEETKIKRNKVKGPSQPVAADEPKSYLPIYILQKS